MFSKLRRCLFLLALLGTMAFGSSNVMAQNSEMTFNVRPLIHFNKTFGKSNWGIASWVLWPNAVASMETIVAVVGPTYRTNAMYAELMFGGNVANRKLIPFIDFRLHLSPRFWKPRIGIPFNLWTNLQLINFTSEKTLLYAFLMVDYALPKGFALIGLETENFFGAKTDTSLGPQIVIPFKPINFILAYQYHFNTGDNQIWLRMMINIMP